MPPVPSAAANNDRSATLREVLGSLAFYLAFYGATVTLGIFALPYLAFAPHRTHFIPEMWSRWHRFCARWLLGIRVVVEGELPGPGVLVAGKHESFFEAIDMPTLLRRPSVFAKVELMRLPIWGPLARHYGLIGVERDQGARALRTMRAEARQRSEEGRVLVIFPEGTRVPHGEIRAPQSGFAGVYKLMGMPVVPLAINSGPLFQRRWKRPGTLVYRFGDPIPPGLPREEIEARVVAAINVLNAG